MRSLLLVLLLAGPVSLWAVPPAVELFNEGESRFLGKTYTSALVSYDEFLQFYPSSDLIADVQYRRAVCLYQLGNYQQASDLLTEIALRYRWTRYIEAVPLWQGLCRYRLSRYASSLVSLNEYLTRGKDPELVPRALLAKALDLEALQKFTEASDTARQIVKDYPRSDVTAPALVLLSSLLVKDKSYDALEQLAAETDPASLPAALRQEFLWNRAEGLWQSGRQAEAISFYQELREARSDISLAAYRRLFAAAQSAGDLSRMDSLAHEMESHFSGSPEVMIDIWAALGVQNYKKGNRDAAWMYLQKAWAQRKARPVDSSVPIYLARILQDRKDTNGARSLLQDYIAQPGASTEEGMLALAVLARDSGELPLAESILTRFLKTYPKAARAPEAAALLAGVEFHEGKVDQSAALVTQYLSGTAGPARADLLLLQAEIARKRGDFATAVAALRDYAQLAPDDVGAGVDLLEVELLSRDYPSVEQGASTLLSAPDLSAKNPRAWILASYLRGLSLVARKDYADAAYALGKIDPGAAERNDLAVIVPYLRYYLAWAYSKTGDFTSSARIVDAALAAYPRHALAPKMLFLAGWSHFNLGEFDTAAKDFSQAADAETDQSAAQKDFYLYARSLVSAKKINEAAAALRRIIDSSPQSPFAPNALFDYAGVADVVTGSYTGAIDAYNSLIAEFPASPLAEDAAYRVGEVFFNQHLYKYAAAAFTDYRRKYPNGRLYDAALYWGGEAAYDAGAKFDAAVLWDQLANTYRTSSFRAAALRKEAEVYQAANDLRRALALYSRFIADYPDEARLAKADIAAEKLRYQIQGLDAAEADLTTRISHSSGLAKLQAMMELARMYIYSGGPDVDQGYQLLQQVDAQGSGVVAGRAQYLEGEYFYRKSDLMQAAKRFVSAAATGAADPDFAASALYRAAEMMKLGQRPDEVDALVKKMTDAYPYSPWTEKARSLQEAQK